MYDLPFGHDRRWLSRAPASSIGARRLAAVAGRIPADRLVPDADDLGPDPDRDAVHDHGDATGGLARPDQLRDPASSDPTIAGWYDVSAFAPHQSGGSARRRVAPSKAPG